MNDQKINRSICLFILTLISFKLADASDGTFKAENLLSIPGCEFDILFPGEPNLSNIYLPESNVETLKAEYGGKNYYLRAECYRLLARDNKSIRAMMFSFGEGQGLSSMQIEESNDKNEKWMLLRGNKKLGDAHATYEIKGCIGTNTILFLYTGTYSNIYPTDEIVNFLRYGARRR